MSRAVAARAGRIVGFVGTCAAALTVVFAGAATAEAHAELVSVDPSDGTMLTTLPDAVAVTFTEAVGRPGEIAVLGPDGSPVRAGELAIVDATATLALEPSGPPASGWYTISYQVTSADGHLVGGTSRFMLHSDADAAPPAGAAVPGGGPFGDADTGADPVVVGALVTGLAVALIVALGAVRRLLVTDAGASP